MYERALAMQAACDEAPGTMAAILGLEDDLVESICKKTSGIVVAANYNCPGQLVISGAEEAVRKRLRRHFTEAGAKKSFTATSGGRRISLSLEWNQLKSTLGK